MKMNLKTTALLTLLVPGLALLGACNDKDADDMAEPAATAPADTMPAETTAPDAMAADAAMPAEATMPAATELTFAEMDKNGDGGVSKDELAPTDMLYEHFEVADTDGNGMLSEEEVTKHRADMAANPAP